MGIYRNVIDILTRFEPEDFKSPHGFLYALNGVAENVFRIQNIVEKKNLQEMLCYLIDKYKLSRELKDDLITKMFTSK